jgi:lipoate-protein ligase B
MLIQDLGLVPYIDAWKLQEQAVEKVRQGAEECAFFLEHPPVITLGRRSGLERHILAGHDHLQRLGVQVVQSDRGGDVTFHGPGQLVVYPIVRLADHGLMVGSYVRQLLEIAVRCLADFGVVGRIEQRAIGVWAADGPGLAKICALGVRIRRGVSMHGIALNLNTDLSYFDLINPCGLGRPVTSLERILGGAAPDMATLKKAMERQSREAFE